MSYDNIIRMAQELKMKNSPPDRYWEIQKARSEKMRELMEEYDRTVYHPALKELQERCLQEHGEHLKSKFHDNGLGWSWWYCGRCGVSHDKVKHWHGDDE